MLLLWSAAPGGLLLDAASVSPLPVAVEAGDWFFPTVVGANARDPRFPTGGRAACGGLATVAMGVSDENGRFFWCDAPSASASWIREKQTSNEGRGTFPLRISTCNLYASPSPSI